jgi:hypothetical protein
MMLKHRIFNADRYLDKLQGYESLLRDYCRLWPRKLGFNVATLTIEMFKTWLVEGESSVKSEVMEGLYRCYDLSTDRGHEDIVAASTDSDYEPDPDASLPVECLALKVRTEREDVFNLAYDRFAFFHAERFSIYQGLRPKKIANVGRRKKAFEKRLSEEFRSFKNSDRVLVRSYEEGDYTHVVVYHEKRVKATLIFKGTKTRPKIASTVFRPAQQDFISYNRATGQVEIEAGYENEEKRVRQTFAKSFFDDADFFDGDDAAQRLDLGAIAAPTFRPDPPEGGTAALVELRFGLAQEQDPFFGVRSKDVLRTLDINGLRRKLKADKVRMAVFKISWAGEKRGKRVELNGSNKITFNRATHADDVFQLLRDWGVMLTNEIEETGAENAAQLDSGAPSRDGQPVASAVRNRRVSERSQITNLGQKKPR